MSNATNLAAVFDEHLRDEFELHDAPATMTTMSESPHVYHLPTMAGGNGKDEVFEILPGPLRNEVAARYINHAPLANHRRRSARR